VLDLFFQALESMTRLVPIALGIVFSYWWIWAPIAVVSVYLETLERHNQRVYKAGLKWVVLELRLPMDPHKSYKAMEQIFSALHSTGGVGDPPEGLLKKFKEWRERISTGKIPDWYTFEMFATGGEIHYYIRCQEKHRAIIESQIFAHYPDSEITPVSDYMAQIPGNIPNENYDLTGTELGLTKDDIFPIRTYPEFEEEGAGKDDARRIDPLAPLAEALSAFLLGEYGAIEFLISPVSEKWTKAWVKKSQGAIDKLMGKEEKKEAKFADSVITGIEGGARSVSDSIFGAGEAPKEEKKKEDKTFSQLNPGVQDIIKVTEKSLAKLQFQVGIRIIYVAKKEKFVKERLATMTAPFRIFSSQALNGFKSTYSPEVKKGSNKEAKTLANKHEFLDHFRAREFPEKPFTLNTEELATIYHFPDVGVKTPALPRVEAKKGEAPAGIPTV
jgi:hypothetical protein